jgi:hypothetical protein
MCASLPFNFRIERLELTLDVLHNKRAGRRPLPSL